MSNALATLEEQKDVVKVNGDMVFNSGFDIGSIMPTAGQLVLDEKQKEILYAPAVEDDIEIRPDGLIYLPWMEYQNRLNKAFGLNWCLIPEGNPKIKDNAVYCKYHLIINGTYMTCTIGEQQYYPGHGMTYSDAVEGARSNALMRCCKHLGITLELWKPSFVRAWKDKYAESYTKNGKTLWKRKGDVNQPPIDVPKPSEPEPKKVIPSPLNDIRTNIRQLCLELNANDTGKATKYLRDISGQVRVQFIPEAELDEVYNKVKDDYDKAFPVIDEEELTDGE